MSTTNNLLNILITDKNIHSYLDSNSNHFLSLSFSEYLTYLLEKKKLKKSEVISDSQLQVNYAYEIFSGKKTPSRDKVIQLCFGFHLNLDEAQRLLNIAGVGSLYAKIQRDSIIIHCFAHSKNIFECNELLLKSGDALLNY